MESVSIDATSVTFPALCIPRDFGVYLVRDVSQLRRVRAQPFWTHRHFAGLRICDSSGRAYEVRTADISSPTSRAGRFLARLLDLTIEVDVKLAPLDSAPLSDVVSAVRKALEVDPESFEELSQRSLKMVADNIEPGHVRSRDHSSVRRMPPADPQGREPPTKR